MTRLGCIAALLALAAAGPARADETGVSAAVSSTEIALDETVQLTVSITRDSTQAYQSYQRPDLKDWDILHQGQAESTQWTMSSGRQSVRTVEQHIYVLKPKHKGPCPIPPAMVKLGGREMRSRDLVVRVTAAARRAPGQPAPGLQSVAPTFPEPEEMRGDEEIFLDATADPQKVYVGQQVMASWQLFTRTDILRYRAVKEPKHDDFWSEDIFSPPGALSWGRQVVRGQDYEVALLLKKALFPLKAGKLTISPLEAEATTLQTAFWAGGSAVRASKPITVEVLPLPAQGRPDGFEASNVGRYAVATTVDKSEVKAGDALTFRVTVRGEGNPRNLQLKKIDHVDGFKLYEPTVADAIDKGEVIRGERTWSYLALPTRGGELTLPAIELPYFDPVEKRYAIARAPSITVRVTGDPQKIGAATAEGAKENVLGARIRPLRNVHHVATGVGEYIVRGRLLWVALATPPSLLALFMVVGNVRARLRRDTAGARRRRARAQMRRRMREAEIHLKGQRPSAFFGACARALYEHLEYRLEVKCEALTLDELKKLLRERGFGAEITEQLAREIESCDFARFAPSASGPGEMRAALRRVRALLAAIERARLSRIEEAA